VELVSFIETENYEAVGDLQEGKFESIDFHWFLQRQAEKATAKIMICCWLKPANRPKRDKLNLFLVRWLPPE
jgi:hypothetical protein